MWDSNKMRARQVDSIVTNLQIKWYDNVYIKFNQTPYACILILLDIQSEIELDIKI